MQRTNEKISDHFALSRIGLKSRTSSLCFVRSAPNIFDTANVSGGETVSMDAVRESNI
jgi:hypothetical protein